MISFTGPLHQHHNPNTQASKAASASLGIPLSCSLDYAPETCRDCARCTLSIALAAALGVSGSDGGVDRKLVALAEVEDSLGGMDHCRHGERVVRACAMERKLRRRLLIFARERLSNGSTFHGLDGKPLFEVCFSF